MLQHRITLEVQAHDISSEMSHTSSGKLKSLNRSIIEHSFDLVHERELSHVFTSMIFTSHNYYRLVEPFKT